MNKKQFRLIIAADATVHVIAAGMTWWDLWNRPETQLRGTPKIWHVASAASIGGSIAYWLVGRRKWTYK